MALFHILSVFRNLTWSQLAARSLSQERRLDAHQNLALVSQNPRGHILGIIGLGNIGYLIAQKAFAAYGMRISYHDIYQKSQEQEAAVKATFCPDLDDLLASADCILIATPFVGKTLLGTERLRKCKEGARIVKIARGSLIDESALVEALRSKAISAAGLDVHANEPIVNHDLGKLENVTLTCHNAGATLDTYIGFERLALENVESFLLIGKASTPVNLQLFAK